MGAHAPTHPDIHITLPNFFQSNTSTQSPRAPALLASEGVISPVLNLKTNPPTHRYNAHYIFRFGDGLMSAVMSEFLAYIYNWDPLYIHIYMCVSPRRNPGPPPVGIPGPPLYPDWTPCG